MSHFRFYNKCRKLSERYDELNQIITYDQACLSKNDLTNLKKEFGNLECDIDVIREYVKSVEDYKECKKILSFDDEEMKQLAQDELNCIKEKVENIENQIKEILLPKDESDSSNIILEIKTGTGGDEAALFAEELFRMYCRYAIKKGWKCEIFDVSENQGGGYKEASAAISGKKVFGNLKFESGTHRVQRVPQTEAKGRVHTSAVTVAIMPEPEDIDIKLDPKDLRIDIYRSSGSGGQSVNTTDSAVRITHIPTGIAVAQQDERSQRQNKEKAMRVLRARLYEIEREKQVSLIASDRKKQIGSGDRSEKIRTYNFPQDRITDHRINFDTSNIEVFMEGDKLNLDEVISELKKCEIDEYFEGEDEE